MKDSVLPHSPLPDVERDGEPGLPDVSPEIVRRDQVEGPVDLRRVLQIEEGPLDQDEVEAVERVVQDVVDDHEELVVRLQHSLDFLELDGDLAVGLLVWLGISTRLLAAPSPARVERLGDRKNLLGMP